MNAILPIVTATVRPGLVFLQRASARLILVEAGELELDEAIAGLLPAFEALVGPCACSREIVDRWERDFPARKHGRSR